MAGAQHEEFQRTFGPLELVALVFKFLHFFEDLRQFGTVLGKRDVELGRLLKDIALAGHVGYQDASFVPDLFRDHMLIRKRVLGYRIDMNACLVGKSAVADIGLALAVRQIRQFVHIPRDTREGPAVLHRRCSRCPS